MTRYLALALILAAVLPAGAQNTIPLFHAGTIRALILSGRNNHDWRATTPCLRDLLTESGRFDVPSGFRRRVIEILAPGTTIVVTPESLTAGSGGQSLTVIENDEG